MALLLGLAGCAAPGYAPVSDRTSGRGAARVEAPRPTPQIAPSRNGLHTVQSGHTLYAIAFANGLDYREIAIWNKLESADRILVGQVLRLTPPPGEVEIAPLDDEPAPAAQPLTEARVLREPQAVLMPYSEANWAQVSKPAVAAAPEPPPSAPPATAPAATAPAATAPAGPASQNPVPTAPVEAWLWPVEGRLAGRFGAAGGKGIDIVGQRNAPVIAVAPGKVVYSGSGLRGYGRLLIVKHAGEYLSAYAHNETILVKEGDAVAAGQKIALMGDSDADRVKLHFEIRRYGKPLDPLNYLPERS
ncbi:peptidoglycan DD-metalloendopeptidase family protein [Thiobacillus denitrificans]|uniref:peptidoglycan DD-metalloendopeptidase family protein n=1 Tax=Thiobacillus denitrificans TaxID=36861 RepID=UPI001EE3FD2A|nr:peptidoglycan DD-metalloendopeptidase family protein [Thiobacillus denitrificans]